MLAHGGRKVISITHIAKYVGFDVSDTGVSAAADDDQDDADDDDDFFNGCADTVMLLLMILLRLMITKAMSRMRLLLGS